MVSEVKKNSYRIDRGGSWGDDAGGARGADRIRVAPHFCSNFLGFRLVRTVKADKQVERWREELEEGLFNEK